MSETTIIILTAIIIYANYFVCAVICTSMKKAVASEAEALTHFHQ